MRKLVAVAVILAVVASLLTYVTFSTVLRNDAVPVTSDFNGLPVITVKVRVPQPTLIIKVNGEERVRMKDPFTRGAAKLITAMFAGKPEGIYLNNGVPPFSGQVYAELFDAPISDLWSVTVPTPNITLTSESFSYTDNGTAIIANITFTGISPITINISSIALHVFVDVSLIPLATNLPSPLVLAVNDSIVVQWIVTLNYGGNQALKNAFLWFIKEIAVDGTPIANNDEYTIHQPEVLVSNGTSSTLSSTSNFVVNTSIPNHAYVIGLAYFDNSVINPAYLVMKAYDYSAGWVTVFNVPVAGLGADRAVLVKIDVSFG